MGFTHIERTGRGTITIFDIDEGRRDKIFETNVDRTRYTPSNQSSFEVGAGEMGGLPPGTMPVQAPITAPTPIVQPEPIGAGGYIGDPQETEDLLRTAGPYQAPPDQMTTGSTFEQPGQLPQPGVKMVKSMQPPSDEELFRMGEDVEGYIKIEKDKSFWDNFADIFGMNMPEYDTDGDLVRAGRFLYVPLSQGPAFQHKKRQYERNMIQKFSLPEDFFTSGNVLTNWMVSRASWEDTISKVQTYTPEIKKIEEVGPADETNIPGGVSSGPAGGPPLPGMGDEDVPVFNRYRDLPWRTVYSDYLNQLPIKSPHEYQFMQNQTGIHYDQFMLDARYDEPLQAPGSPSRGFGLFGPEKEVNPYAQFLDDYNPLTGAALTSEIDKVLNIITTPEDEWSSFDLSKKDVEGHYSEDQLRDYRWWWRYKAGQNADKNQTALAALPIRQSTPMVLQKETDAILDRLHQRWLADPNRQGDNWLAYVKSTNYFGMIPSESERRDPNQTPSGVGSAGLGNIPGG